MKKYLALILAVVSLIIFNLLILKNEHHLKNHPSIFIELQPVDPRSLIQGDYMVLNYNLKLDESLSRRLPISSYHQSSLLSYIVLDQNRVVTKTLFSLQQPAVTAQKLRLKNPDNSPDSLYPAANSFLFAEGLADCYNNARYAEFKVDIDGNALLASLRGKNLQPLNCEQQAKWQQANPSTNR